MKNKNNLFIVIVIILIIIIVFELIYFGKFSNKSTTTNNSLNNNNSKTYGQATWILTINSITWKTINSKSNLVINLTFECKEKHKKCMYESNTLVKNKSNETIARLIDAKFESTISDSIDSTTFGGDSVTGNFYIELEKQDDIYISYLDLSDTSESAFGKLYKIEIN